MTTQKAASWRIDWPEPTPREARWAIAWPGAQDSGYVALESPSQEYSGYVALVIPPERIRTSGYVALIAPLSRSGYVAITAPPEHLRRSGYVALTSPVARSGYVLLQSPIARSGYVRLVAPISRGGYVRLIAPPHSPTITEPTSPIDSDQPAPTPDFAVPTLGVYPITTDSVLTPLSTPRVAPLGTPSYHSFMRGKWLDLTDWVSSAQWRHGQQLLYQAGSVMSPANGSLLLDNRDVDWNPFINNHPDIETSPGNPIEIWEGQVRGDGELLFNGWTQGVTLTTPNGQTDAAFLTFHGPIARIGRIQEGIFLQLNGILRIDDVFARMLNFVGWVDPTYRDIRQGVISVFGNQLGRTNQFGTGRQFSDFLDGCKTLALLEGGIIYDDRRGRIVFESFNNPRREQRTRPIVINDEDVYEGKARDTDAGILNEIVGQYTEVNVLGLQDITIIDPDGDDLPYSVTVSANNSCLLYTSPSPRD